MSYIIKGVRIVMGTLVMIAVACPRVDEAKEAMRTAFNEIYRIQNLMSIHNESSEVSILNRNGFYQGMSTDIKHVIQRANYFAELSDGTFNIAILPILKLWEERAHASSVPTSEEIDKDVQEPNHPDDRDKSLDYKFKNRNAQTLCRHIMLVTIPRRRHHFRRRLSSHLPRQLSQGTQNSRTFFRLTLVHTSFELSYRSRHQSMLKK